MIKKHNKKRNTAFLFEILIQESAKSLVNKDLEYHHKVNNIIREFFNNRTNLNKDITLYLSIIKSNNNIKDILSEACNERKNIDTKSLYEEQSRLIKRINKELNSDSWDNFIPNYRTLGAIYHLFNSEMSINERVDTKKEIEKIILESKRPGNTLEPIDSITFNVFIKKFNEKYKDSLNIEQKRLIKEYINSIGDDTFLKMHVGDELQRIEGVILKNMDSTEPATKERLGSVLNVISECKKSKVNDGLLVKLLKMQKLAEELNSTEEI